MGCSCSGLRVLLQASSKSVGCGILPLAIRNRPQPSQSLFQVGTAAPSSWDVLHLAAARPSCRCQACWALKSHPNRRLHICGAHQRLDAASWHGTAAKGYLDPCCVRVPAARWGIRRNFLVLKCSLCIFISAHRLGCLLNCLPVKKYCMKRSSCVGKV